MDVVVVTPPDPFVELEIAKKHLRVDGTDEDDLIGIYIAAACSHIDGPHTWLGRALGVQTLRASFSAFDGGLLRLPGLPLQTIASVIYDDANGVAQTIDGDLYSLDAAGVLLASGAAWPTPRDRLGAVRVEYTAGYSSVPAPIVAATLLMVGDLYDTRASTIPGPANAVPMSTTVERLLGPYRICTV